MIRQWRKGALAASLLASPGLSTIRAQAANHQVVATIRAEERAHPRVMEIASWLSDVSGSRLTWSPGFARAASWAVGELRSWGLDNVHLEPWYSPRGIGWENKRFSLMAVTPTPFIVQAIPGAFSVGTAGPVIAQVALIEAQCARELKARYAGALRHAFIMTPPATVRPANDYPQPPARWSDEELAQLALLAAPSDSVDEAINARRRSPPIVRDASARRGSQLCDQSGRHAALALNDTSVARWLVDEGVSGVLLEDPSHVGGTIATLTVIPRDQRPPAPPIVHVGHESFGRIARILQKHLPVTLELNMENVFNRQDSSAANVVAELRGSDPALSGQVVLIGAHLDSWHGASGATDNAAGAAVVLEAARILKSIGVEPRRTIRIALWSGEEQGRLGSIAYANEHFVRGHETLSVYLNLDNGGGRIRGVYLNGMAAARPVFDEWMTQLGMRELQTATIANTRNTDHVSFIETGNPAFQFIQDPLDYGTVTHHTNQDVYERLISADMEFNAVVMASFAWFASERDGLFPRPH